MRAGPGLLFIGLNAVDAGTTAYLMTHGAREANPIMAAILALGTPSFIAMKVAAAAAIAALLVRYRPGPLRVVNLVFACIVAWQGALCLVT